MPVPSQSMLTDSHLAEHTVSSETVFQGRLLQVRLDHVRLPDGKPATREYVVHPGAAMVVPLHDDGSVTLVRQYRYPLARAFLEFPAGKLDVGEAPLECARRELAEEVGLVAHTLTVLTTVHNAIAYSNEAITLFLAQGLSPVAQRLDEGEFLDVLRVPLEQVLAGIQDGSISDVKTIIGGLMASKVLRNGYSSPT